MAGDAAKWFADLKPKDRALANVIFNVSLHHGYVYCAIPKAGCTAILHALQKAEAAALGLVNQPAKVHIRKETPLLQWSRLDADGLREAFDTSRTYWFTVVRNPFSRVLSAYLEKICRPTWQLRNFRRMTKLDDRGAAQFTPERDGFRRFLHVLETQAVQGMDAHWRPQWALCRPGAIAYHKIGYLETIDTDIAGIFGHLNAKRSVSYFLPSVSGREHGMSASTRLDEFYDSEAAGMVQAIYSRDFEFFGYSPRLEDATAAPVKRVPARGLATPSPDENVLREINGSGRGT